MSHGYAKRIDRERAITAARADYDRLKAIGEYVQELVDDHDRQFMDMERKLQNLKQGHEILNAVEILDFWKARLDFGGPIEVPSEGLKTIAAALSLPYLVGDAGRLTDAQAQVGKWEAGQGGPGPNHTIAFAGLELVRSVLWKDKGAPTTKESAQT